MRGPSVISFTLATAIIVIALNLAAADIDPPEGTRSTLAPIARGSPGQEVDITYPPNLSFLTPDTNNAVDVKVAVKGFDGTTVVLYIDHSVVKRQDGGTVDVEHAVQDLEEGLHRVYVVIEQGGNSVAEASVQFYVTPKPFDPIDYFTKACVDERMFSIGANHPCDGVFQMGHEMRREKRYDEAEPLLWRAVEHHDPPIVYPFLELAQLYAGKGDMTAAKRARQAVERIHPGYIPARSPFVKREVTGTPVIDVVLDEVYNEDLSPYAHLFCLWSGMIITRHAGISHDKAISSAATPGNHYKLLAYLTRLMPGTLVVELGTLHAAATVALASHGNKVISFNVHDDLGQNLRRCGISEDDFKKQVPGELEFRIADATDEDGLRLAMTAGLIFVDTNHHGDIEDMLYQYLAAMEWQGIMVLDDIFLNREMDSWWGSVSHPKYDLTDFGHTASGTGIIDFGDRLRFHHF